MAYLALDPVQAALFTKLNVAGLQVLVNTRIYDVLPQGVTYPCVLQSAREHNRDRGFGTGGFPRVDIAISAFTRFDTREGMKQAQQIAAKVVELLRDQSLSVSGYTQAGLLFYDDTVPMDDDVINGVRVHEVQARFYTWVEEA